MADRRSTFRRILRYAGLYGGVFSLAFAATVYWTFPYGLVAGKLVGELERSLGVELEIGRLSPHWLLGLQAEDVVVGVRRRDGDDTRIVLDTLRARLRPIDTLLSGPAVAFDLQGELGRLRGTANRTRNQDIGIEVTVADISLGTIPGLADSLGVGLLGVVSGNVDVSFPGGNTELVSGVLDLRIASSGLGGGMVKGATIPPIDFGDISLRVVAEGGNLRFEPNLGIASDDLDAEVIAGMQLRGSFATSRAEITLRFRPTDRFWQANQMLGTFARAMMRDAEQSDGYYVYRHNGAIGRPDFQPVR